MLATDHRCARCGGFLVRDADPGDRACVSCGHREYPRLAAALADAAALMARDTRTGRKKAYRGGRHGGHGL